MFECDIALKSYSAEDFMSAANLDRADASVVEVFSLMFGFDIEVVQPSEVGLQAGLNTSLNTGELDERSAIVGFSGPMRGSCQVRIGSLAARSVASAMLGGTPVEEDDDSIDDALGELCNMIAGAWKNGVPAFSACTLSPPTVVSGRNYKVHFHKRAMKIARIYKFGGHMLHLTLHCETMGCPNS